MTSASMCADGRAASIEQQKASLLEHQSLCVTRGADFVSDHAIGRVLWSRTTWCYDFCHSTTHYDFCHILLRLAPLSAFLVAWFSRACHGWTVHVFFVEIGVLGRAWKWGGAYIPRRLDDDNIVHVLRQGGCLYRVREKRNA